MIHPLNALRCAALICLFSLSVNAVSKPEINGVSVHSEFGAEKFIAALFVDTKSESEQAILGSDQNKAMEIRVLANTLYSRKFKRMWIEGIAINASKSDLEKHAQDLSDFTRILRVKLRQGDILRINRTKGKETTLFINDIELGRISNTSFFDLLLRTWIGAVPLSSDFKQELLSNGNPDPRLLKRFQYTKPTPSRLVQLARALGTAQAATVIDKDLTPPPVTQSLSTAAETVKITTSITPEPTTIPKPKTTITESQNTSVAAIPNKPSTEIKPNKTIAKNVTPTPKKSEPKKVITKVSDPTRKPISDSVIMSDDDIFDDESDTFSAADLLQQQLYISKLTRWTGRFLKYPRFAQRKGQEGTVKITIFLNRDGSMIRSELTEKSPHAALNKAAIKTVKSAIPYPKVPLNLLGDEFRFTIPVAFKLR